MHGLDISVRGDVKVEVEVRAVGTHPGKGEAETFLVSFDFVDWGARDSGERRVVRFQMLKWGDVVAHQRARGTTRVAVGFEHEVVDDELWAAVEEVIESHLLGVAGGVHTLELIWLRDLECR